jgi:hypothetical protein
MNKLMGRKGATMVGVGLLAASMGIFLLGRGTARVHAAADKAVTDAILKIADAIKKGDSDEAKKLAGALAKKIDDFDDVMAVLKPRKKNGVGVGKTPGAIVPDAIELMLNNLGRDGPDAKLLAKADALEELAYVTAAVGEVAYARGPIGKLTAKQTKKDWLAWSQEVRSGAADLAKAAKAKGAQDIKSAAAKINTACNSCHSAFR